ncbi:MAG TPA: anti-sigma factor [bacterium]|nr:anti-sigma factor [bacterium]
MTHEELRELIPAYAIDALDLEDERAVEVHLEACPACQRDLAELRAVAAELAAGVGAVDPPPALRGRVLDAVRVKTRGPIPAPSPRPRWVAGALAAAAGLLIILGGLAAYQSQRINALSGRLDQQDRLLALLAAPTTRSAQLTGSVRANVRFVYDRASGRGALVVTGLNDPGAGLVYEIWLVAGTQPRPAGIFRSTPGQPVIIPVAADFGRYRAVAISIEHGPQGSSGGPTTAPILAASI